MGGPLLQPALLNRNGACFAPQIRPLEETYKFGHFFR